jgi:hypothetical protein
MSMNLILFNSYLQLDYFQDFLEESFYHRHFIEKELWSELVYDTIFIIIIGKIFEEIIYKKKFKELKFE